MGKYYRVYADVDLGAVEDNVKALKKLAAPQAKVMAVVKADGYGHGDAAIAKAVYSLVYGYAVATLDEAVNLRENGIDKPILVLGVVNPDEYKTLVEKEAAATVFDYGTAKRLSEAAKALGKKAVCHIKVDTGMRRIGLEPDADGADTIRRIMKLENLDVEGIFTHFAGSDMADKTSAQKQLNAFQHFLSVLEKENIRFRIRHCANSAAVIDMPQACMDMVRLGIAMYGMYPSDEVDKSRVSLRPAMELKSHVTMVKTVPAGEPVSYGGTFVTQRETKLATVSVGYGDGYPRALSSKGYVLIRGRRAPIIGRVCMDQMMVDATGIEDIRCNDIVTLFGHDGNSTITVEEIAALAGTFNYEFVCDLNKRVPRNYYYNGEYIGSHDYFHEQWTLKNL